MRQFLQSLRRPPTPYITVFNLDIFSQYEIYKSECDNSPHGDAGSRTIDFQDEKTLNLPLPVIC